MTSFLPSLIALIVFLLAVQATIRLFPRTPPVTVYFLTALAIHAVATGIGAVQGDLVYWRGAALYWFGFMAYLFVFGVAYKSISLKMLRHLWWAPGHRLDRDTLAAQVALPAFTGRIAILVEGGLVEEVEGGYRITAKGLEMAQRIRKVQGLFGIDRSGLYDH